MIIGSFEYSPAQDTYLGEIVFLDRKLWLKPTDPEENDGGDYLIAAPAEWGNFVLGAGWKRKTPGGESYVAVTIDYPTLPAPVHAALFLRESDDADAVLVWDRPHAGSP
jgi:uncharacterized protein (DUF736 family)